MRAKRSIIILKLVDVTLTSKCSEFLIKLVLIRFPAEWSRTATQNKKNLSLNTATTRALHSTSRSSSVISDATNSSGTFTSQSERLTCIYFYTSFTFYTITLCLFSSPRRLCVCRQRDIWRLRQRRRPQRDSQAKYVTRGGRLKRSHVKCWFVITIIIYSEGESSDLLQLE